MFEEKEAYSLHSRLVFVGRCYCNHTRHNQLQCPVSAINSFARFWLSFNDHGDVGDDIASALFSLRRICGGSVLRHWLLSLLTAVIALLPLEWASSLIFILLILSSLFRLIHRCDAQWCPRTNIMRFSIHSQVKRLSSRPYPIHNLTIIMVPYPIGGAAAIVR